MLKIDRIYLVLSVLGILLLCGCENRQGKSSVERGEKMIDRCEITVYVNDVVKSNFGGVGFHVFHHSHNVQRIGSTIATEFLDEVIEVNKNYSYKIVAVDQSGNARD